MRKLFGKPGADLFLFLYDEILGVLSRLLDRVSQGPQALVSVLEDDRAYAERVENLYNDP